jgi:hypothetical protein
MPAADEARRRRIAAAGGILTGKLAQADLEGARVILRRQVWNLTEESGGCPIGAPELIGEILANNAELAREFASLLISYLDPEGNFLEHTPLLRGAIWGAGRLARAHPGLAGSARPLLTALQDHEDAGVRQLAAETLGVMRQGPAADNER